MYAATPAMVRFWTILFCDKSNARGAVLFEAGEIGLSSVAIGAGRTRADQKIDPAAGIRLNRKPGDPTKKGDALAEIHASNRETARAIENRVLAAFSFTRNQIKPSPLVLGRV